MLPPFDPQGGVSLACARGAAVAGLLSVFGGQVFRVAVMRHLARQDVAAVEPPLQALERWGVAGALVAMGAWFWVQSRQIAGVGSLGDSVAAVVAVARATTFGHLALLQIGALGVTAILLFRRRRSASGCLAAGCIALGLQAAHGHAASMDRGPSPLLLLDLLHLAGAGAWLGGLMPLLVVVRGVEPRVGASAARWFSRWGKLAVVAVAVSAVGQGWVLAGSVADIVGTAYGWVLLGKLVLFGALLGFAVINRSRFAPALLGAEPARARRMLVRSITVQTGFALAVVLAAAVLSNLPPAMHVQPVWPFAERFSLAAVREEADFRAEVLEAGGALVTAVVLLGIAVMLRRRLSLVPAVAAAAIAWRAIPHLDLLFVPAYPSSYYHSPTGFAASSIMAGAALYPGHCAACHGDGGRGDGPLAAALPVPPADLTAAHLWMHADGELFWWLAHGIAAPDGRPAMPGFAGVLSGEQLWALIDYIRARNAGVAYRESARWPVTMRAPDFTVRCPDPDIATLSDLLGGFVRLNVAPARAVAGVTTITLGGGDPLASGLCIGEDAAVAGAYGLLVGMAPAALTGTSFLIDGNGWLRAVHPAGGGPGWDDPRVLGATLRALRAHPPAPPDSDAMPMDMRM